MNRQFRTLGVVLLVFGIGATVVAAPPTPKEPTATTTKVATPTEPKTTATIDTKTPPSTTPVTFRTFLNKVPVKGRTKFLQSMVFKNGGLAGANIGDLKGSLSPTELKTMMAMVNCDGWHEGWYCTLTRGCIKSTNAGDMCNPDKCASQPKVTDVGFAFADLKLSADEQTKFFDSLDFVGGKLISIYVDGPKKSLKDSEFQNMIKALGGSPADVTSKATAGVFKQLSQ